MNTHSNRTEQLVALTILIWGLITFGLGYYHVFDNTSSMRFGLCIMAIQISLILLYFFNRKINNYLNSINLSTFAMLHVWRIFAGWIFIAYADHLPKTFVNNAAFGDLVAGFLAIGVFITGRTKLSFYIFNIVGLIDFIIAVGTGIILSLQHVQGTKLLTELPLIIIPFFGVPISGLTHIVAFAKLKQMKNVRLKDRID